jgi:hypothetical protein
MTAKWISGTLQITPETVAERDALLMIWNIKKDNDLPYKETEGTPNPLQEWIDAMARYR